MPEVQNAAVTVDELAEEFAQRWRAGEQPSVDDYAARYPHLAEDIRAVLPAVMMLEQLKPRREDASSSRVPVHEPPPERLGEYRILSEIGRGGMGVVYEADHEALGRHVAIKVLPSNLLSNQKLRMRFRHEAQAAARLHHTNIVPVFAVGESEGHCYYVMQLINGRGLDQMVRAMAATRAGVSPATVPAHTVPFPAPHDIPDSSASWPGHNRTPAREPAVPSALAVSSFSDYCRTVARMAAQVADALNYAHSQGVLHRDIKPSNLLLDDRGTVWVTDFGVAKLVQGASLTQSGDLMGTLKYMPPEQFSGQSDGRGDVYSLGVTLYELLTLRSAFPDTTPQHLIRLITEQTPVRPREINPNIPTDLETIILKAAAREPARRYQTPAELADDLQRFLYDRPILARRTSITVRFWRWCRRNPALATAAVAPVLVMAAATAMSISSNLDTAAKNREVVAAKQETEKALDARKAELERVEKMSALALEGLNRTYERFAPARLVVTPAIRSAEGDLPARPAALPPEAIPLLEGLLQTYEEIAKSGVEFPKLQPAAAEANHRIGDIQQRLGRFAKAETAYRTTIDLYTKLADDADPDAYRIKLARAYNDLGRTLHALHRSDEAVKLNVQSIQTLSAASRAFADRPECRFELARSYYALAHRNGASSFSEPAPTSPPMVPKEPPRLDFEFEEEQPGKRAATILEQLTTEYPAVPEYRHLLACCYRDFTTDRLDRAVKLLRQLTEQFPGVPDYQFDFCETLARTVPTARATTPELEEQEIQRLREAIGIAGTLMGKYRNVPDYAVAHARYLDRLGTKYFEAGKLPDAARLERQAIEFQAALVDQYPDAATYSLAISFMERTLGRILAADDSPPEARTHLETAIERAETLLKKNARLANVRPFLAQAYRDLADVLKRLGDDEAMRKALVKSDEFAQGAKK